MGRRESLVTVTFLSGMIASLCNGAELPSSSSPVTLSEHGCGRATGYAVTNKIVTLRGRTHVAWLDSLDGQFLVRVRSLTRATGTWSPVSTIGNAHDNHGGPALAADSRGYLHIVYFPHHHPFRYRRSVRPNDSSEWTPEVSFGSRCTYPSMVMPAIATGSRNPYFLGWLTFGGVLCKLQRHP